MEITISASRSSSYCKLNDQMSFEYYKEDCWFHKISWKLVSHFDASSPTWSY